MRCELTEVPAAFVELRPGVVVSAEELLAHCRYCGYSPEEAASLAPVWVPGHAPFYAYGIYQLDWPPA